MLKIFRPCNNQSYEIQIETSLSIFGVLALLRTALRIEARGSKASENLVVFSGPLPTAGNIRTLRRCA